MFPEQYCYDSDLEGLNKESVNMADKIIELNLISQKEVLDDINIKKFSVKELKTDYSNILFGR